MSEENVEIVRAAIEAWSRGDWDAMFKDAAPDFEVDNTRDLGEWRGVHTTRDQLMRALESFAEPWESVQVEAEQLIDAGDQVVARTRATLTGRDGIEITARNNALWTLRDGQITHGISGFETTEEALEAAGLEE